jgi:hypothetical protein
MLTGMHGSTERANRYWAEARKLREIAESAPTGPREGLLKAAADYERLAASIERTLERVQGDAAER